jgi:hypothetical protein
MVDENVGSILKALTVNNVRISKEAISGYRTATGYLVTRCDAGFKHLRESAPKAQIHGKAQRAIGTAGTRLTEYCGTIFERVSNGVEKATERADDLASSTIDRLAAKVSKISNKRAVRYIGLASQMSVPPLKVLRDVSAWIATRVASKHARRVNSRGAIKRIRKVAKPTKRTLRAA